MRFRTGLQVVRFTLGQALLHILKCRAWPSLSYVPHWRAEPRVFRGNAADAFAPSMRQRIDVDALYRRARRGWPDSIDGQTPLPIPEVCPMPLDEMLSES